MHQVRKLIFTDMMQKREMNANSMNWIYHGSFVLVLWMVSCQPSGKKEEYFMRYSTPDTTLLAAKIEIQYDELKHAVEMNDSIRAFMVSIELGENLTIAQKEDEAIAVMEPFWNKFGDTNSSEDMAWLMLNLATAFQYSNRTEEAENLFVKTLKVCEQNKYRSVQHYASHHYGRFLVEAGKLEQAHKQFLTALKIRSALNDSHVESTERALDSLRKLMTVR